MIYKRAKDREEAHLISEFVQYKGYDAEIESHNGFMSDKYPFRVVGDNEEVLGLMERHDQIVNVATSELKRKATWKKPKSQWDKEPKRIRT